MNRIITAHKRSLLVALILASGTPATGAAADDYLSILEAEAESTGKASDITAAEAGPQVPHATSFGSNQTITPGLSLEEFEAELGSEYSGSHILYSKLSLRDRDKVYRFYQGENRISAIREQIVKLLSSG